MGEPDDYLRLFDSDPNRATKKYAELWIRLVRFFEWRGCQSPEDLAQETLARGFKRISNGVNIYTADPVNFFFGVARNVVREDRKDVRNGLPVSLDGLPEMAALNVSQVEARICLDQCLSRLPSSERKLLLSFYTEDRELVGRKLHLSANALRVRAHRARKKLEELIHAAMKKAPAA